MIAPLPQNLKALGRANEVRLARAEVRRRVRTGETSAAEVILLCPPEVASMTITELLCCQGYWGTERTRRFLNGLAVRETKTLGSLTDRQRNLLAEWL